MNKMSERIVALTIENHQLAETVTMLTKFNQFQRRMIEHDHERLQRLYKENEILKGRDGVPIIDELFRTIQEKQNRYDELFERFNNLKRRLYGN